MAVNEQGDRLIGFAQFSSNIHPSGAYLLVLADGSRATSVFAAGQNTYVKRFGGNTNRWGDYSPTQVDSRDDNNYVRIHQTLRTSPAMAAGVSKTLWSMDDVVRMVEEWEVTMRGGNDHGSLS